jgi:alkylation response protein AidB-like acyl-CoA dehydrogenase
MPAFGTDERRQLHETLLAYLGTTYTFAAFRKLQATPERYGRENWAEYARLGWLGTSISEDAGGAGGGLTELGILMSACGQGLLLEPLLQTLVLGAGAVERGGTPAQKSDLLAKIAAGDLMLAFAHTEPMGGFDRGYVRTIATKTSNGWRLDGAKSFVLHANAANQIIVSARVGGADGRLGLFVVPREAKGLHLTASPAIDGRPGAALEIKGVEVPATARLGSGDADAMPVIDAVLDRGALAVCAEACGAMQSVNAITLDYLKQRKQFGQPLASFQVLQHRLVDMTIASEETRAVVHAALAAVDAGSPKAAHLIATAKVQAARAARFVGGQGVQLHGGMGMTDELSVGHYYKRLMLCESQFGDADWWMERLAVKG